MHSFKLQRQTHRNIRNVDKLVQITINSENIAIVYFLRFLRLASDAKLKFAMISAATFSV